MNFFIWLLVLSDHIRIFFIDHVYANIHFITILDVNKNEKELETCRVNVSNGGR